MSNAKLTVYVDPGNHDQLRDQLFERESNPYAGDHILAPFTALKDHLVARGMAVRTADYLPDRGTPGRKLVISFGAPDRLVSQTVRRYTKLSQRPDVVLSGMFVLECPIVEPTLYEALPTFARLFRRMFSWSDADALLPFTRSRVDVGPFRWPQSADRVHEDLWARQDRGFLVMMNTNKLPRLYVNELYTARLRAIEYFHRFGEIDVYGRYWNKMPARLGKTRVPVTVRRIEGVLRELKQAVRPDPLYAAAAAASRGPVASKCATLAGYRFALCFENSVLRGWMTEKLFDCFFSGTIPIYWGAPEVLEWVPGECFIDMRQFHASCPPASDAAFAELRSFLHGLSPAAIARYREAARDYVASDRFAPFRTRTFVARIADVIDADAEEPAA